MPGGHCAPKRFYTCGNWVPWKDYTFISLNTEPNAKQTMEQPVTSLSARAEQHVCAFYREFIDEKYLYHNYQHVRDVVDASRRLGQLHQLPYEEMELLELAAWFHDTGFSEGAEGHEVRSARNAARFLEKQMVSPERIRKVEALIMATQPASVPGELLEELIRDADLSHLGSELYWDRSSRVRQELLMTRQNFMPEEEWVQFELDFMLRHYYHTEVARQLYDATKQKNIKQLRKYQLSIQPPEFWSEEDREKKKKKKNKDFKDLNLGRGVETMFRTSYRMHTNLSAIADNKANIMLSVNGIIISIVISSLVPKLGVETRLVVPTFILLAFCLSSLVFAILASSPKVTKGVYTREDIRNRSSNLLFFGNFYKMPIEDFEWGVMEMIKDSDFLYSSMTRDLYYLGIVLAHKYRLIRICYMVFMVGLIASVLAFGLAYLL